MTLSTWELETIKNEVAEVREFYRQRMDADLPPLREELERLSRAVGDLTEKQRVGERQAMLARFSGGGRGGERGGDRPRVPFGKYQGMDALDLACVRSVLAAQQREPGDVNPRALEDWQANLKAAMDSATAGSGDELVATGEAAALWADINVDTLVAGLFTRVDMPTNPFEIPLQLGDVSWYPGTENTATTETALTTGRQTLTAYELVAEVPWSLTLEEDAVIAMAAEVRSTLVRNAVEVIDDVLLNADTTAQNNINADGATIAVSTAGKAHWLVGFRRPAAPAAGGQHGPGQQPRGRAKRRHVQRGARSPGQVRRASVGAGLHRRRGHVHQVAGSRRVPHAGQAGAAGDAAQRATGAGGRHSGDRVGAAGAIRRRRQGDQRRQQQHQGPAPRREPDAVAAGIPPRADDRDHARYPETPEHHGGQHAPGLHGKDGSAGVGDAHGVAVQHHGVVVSNRRNDAQRLR